MKSRNQEITNIVSSLLAATMILLASMFCAIQFTETMSMMERSNKLPLQYWWIFPLSSVIGMLLSWILFRDRSLWKYLGFILTLSIAFAVDRAYYNPPTLRLTWFVGVALLQGSGAFLVTGLVLKERFFSFRKTLGKLLDNAYLTRIWTLNSVQSKYSQNVLGIVWVILEPLTHALVMAFMFSFILGRGEIAGKPFIIFLLSGIVVYNIFSRTVMLSANSLIGNMSVIKQIYFPREIVLLTLFGEVLLDFAFSFIALLIINTLFSVFPNYYYLLLPFPLIIMSILSLGVSFFVSFWSLRIRDLRQIISIVLRLLFYITVLFTLRIATPEIEIFGVVNPLTVLVEFFRTVILYESAPDFALLVWPTSLALVFAYSGYVFYKSNEGRIVYYS